MGATLPCGSRGIAAAWKKAMREDSNQVKKRALFTCPKASISPQWMGNSTVTG